MRFDALLVDWDGTLIDSLPIKIDNAAALFAEWFGADQDQVRRSYDHYSGIPRRELFESISMDSLGKGLSETDFRELSARFSEENRKSIRSRATLRTDVVEILSQLNSNGVALYVSTSAVQEEVEPLVAHFGLNAHFAGVLGSRPGFSKGEDHVAFVSRELSLERHRIAGIGDDVLDVDLFRNASITAIAITGTRTESELLERGADHVIGTLKDLKVLFEEC